MDSPQNIKKRLKSVSNINKITKAMELVAATKMRRSQEITLASRPYAFVALDLLANLSLIEKSKHLPLPDLLKKRAVKKTLFVLVASDKGLAGAFNSSLFRKFERYILQNPHEEEDYFAAVGEKSFQYLSKRRLDVIHKFTKAGDFTSLKEVHPLADFFIKGYVDKAWDRVLVFSTHFTSALKQEPMVREILPVTFDSIKETIQEIIPAAGKFAALIKEYDIRFVTEKKAHVRYLIEPSPEIVLEYLAHHLMFMQTYHLILEANASEHSARRLAMKTASDNASQVSEQLNLHYNKLRQSAITKEIIEITTGAEAL